MVHLVLLEIPIGRTETASVWAIGETWLKVPESLKITFENSVSKGVYAKDIILEVIGQISADGATYKSMEFYGKAIDKLSISDRMTISNMSAEAGAKAGIFPTDKIIDDWNRQFDFKYERLTADEDAIYEQELFFDLADLTPRVAQPHKVDNVIPVGDLPRTNIDVALLGTCTNGRIEDLRVAAEILKEKKIDPKVRLLVYPASRKILHQTIKEQILEILIDAGGQIGVPACGPCLGEYGGTLAPGEKAISTANRNFKGRMGTRDAEIFLANPAVVAKSAVAGYITDEEI